MGSEYIPGRGLEGKEASEKTCKVPDNLEPGGAKLEELVPKGAVKLFLPASYEKHPEKIPGVPRINITSFATNPARLHDHTRHTHVHTHTIQMPV